jgi:glutamine cyclotransferase
MDPVSFETVRTQAVQVAGGSITNLNELEYINGEVWANIWMKDRIARIDPQSGNVTGWIDLEGLLPADQRTPKTDVLNGIAWDAETERLFVTGKNWPWLFEVELVPGE